METEAPATTASTVTTAAEPPLKSSTQAAQHKSASVRTAPGVRADPQVESHSSAADATLASCASGTGNTSTATGGVCSMLTNATRPRLHMWQPQVVCLQDLLPAAATGSTCLWCSCF